MAQGQNNDQANQVEEGYIQEGRLVIVAVDVHLVNDELGQVLILQVGQGALGPVGLLVHKVAPSPQNLGRHDARRHDVQDQKWRQHSPVAEDEQDDRPGNQAAVNGNPPVPDGDDLAWVLGKIAPLEDDVVKPRPNEAQRDAP